VPAAVEAGVRSIPASIPGMFGKLSLPISRSPNPL
jgi:hypothetical protein